MEIGDLISVHPIWHARPKTLNSPATPTANRLFHTDQTGNTANWQIREGKTHWISKMRDA